MDTLIPTDPLLAAVNTAMTSQGLPQKDSLWFYTDGSAYKLESVNGAIQLYSFNRPGSQPVPGTPQPLTWTLVQTGTVEATVAYLNAHGPFIPQNLIGHNWAVELPHTAAWGNQPHPANTPGGVDPNIHHRPDEAPPIGGVGNVRK